MIIDPKQIIISRYELQNRKHKALSLALILIFWGGLLYLMRPILIVIGWALAYYLFRSTSFDVEGHDIIRTVITSYLPMILFLSLSLISWAAYNLLRFRGQRDKRRVPAPELGFDELCATTTLPVEDISRLRDAKVTIFFFDESGAIKRAESGFSLGVKANLNLARAVRAETPGDPLALALAALAQDQPDRRNEAGSLNKALTGDHLPPSVYQMPLPKVHFFSSDGQDPLFKALASLTADKVDEVRAKRAKLRLLSTGEDETPVFEAVSEPEPVYLEPRPSDGGFDPAYLAERLAELNSDLEHPVPQKADDFEPDPLVAELALLVADLDSYDLDGMALLNDDGPGFVQVDNEDDPLVQALAALSLDQGRKGFNRFS